MVTIGMTKTIQTQLLKLLNTYCGWNIEERKPGQWVVVVRNDGHVITDTWAGSLKECKEKTMIFATKCLLERKIAKKKVAKRKKRA